MSVLVDTAVWSLALRRKQSNDVDPYVLELQLLIQEFQVEIIGAIRQEVLSGIREQAQYERLRNHLRAFADLPLTTADYELAADYFNVCRGSGIQGSNTDFLICAVANRLSLSILTTDADFGRYQQVIPIDLHTLRP